MRSYAHEKIQRKWRGVTPLLQVLFEWTGIHMRFLVCVFLLASTIGYSAENEIGDSTRHMVFFKDYQNLPKGELKPWIAYNYVLGDCINEEGSSYTAFSLDCEVKSREAILKVLKGKQIPSYYLDIAEVSRKGYLQEYSFFYHRQEQWAIPEPGKYLEFKLWAKTRLAEHVPQKHVLGMMSNHITDKASGAP